MANKHKHVSFIITMALGFIVTANAQVTVALPEQVTANRQAEIKKQYDADAFAWYAVYNDDKGIYVHVAIIDSMQKRKIVQNGIELWIDCKGKKNKVTGIMFPLKANNYPGGGDRNAAGGPPSFFSNTPVKNADSALQQLTITKTEAETKGLFGMADGKQNITQLAGITLQLRMMHDTLVYDAMIPFAALPASTKNTFGIGIVEKGVAIPGFGGSDMGGPDGDMGAPPPPGDGGGFMPPPDMQPGEVDMRRLFETNTIWYKLILRAKP